MQSRKRYEACYRYLRESGMSRWEAVLVTLIVCFQQRRDEVKNGARSNRGEDR
jgi:hypothetical protein